MNKKLEIENLKSDIKRLRDDLHATTDNLYLLMNFVDKSKVVVKFSYPNLILTFGSPLKYERPLYKVYYFSGDDIKCAHIPSLYTYGSKNGEKQVPYEITRNDDKVITIKFEYPKSVGGDKVYLIDKINKTLSDITLNS